MTAARLDLTRAQILGHRRRVGELDRRLPPGERSLRRAAWAGLQDSVPRAALHSIHARVEGTEPTTWEDPSLVQLWGPRFSAYVVAERDRAVFSLGRLSDDVRTRQTAYELADRLEEVLGGTEMAYREAGRALGENPNRLRYAAPTGRVLIRWDGASPPTIWTVPAPDVDPVDARLELARRYLHVLGPGTPDGFATWAGIRSPRAIATFEMLGASMTPVQTPIGDRWILSGDEPGFREGSGHPGPARLLPSGDAYFLCWGEDRDLLVAEAEHRGRLWTSRVWPGAVLVDGEIVGTWRRAKATVTVSSWRRLSQSERQEIEADAASMPLPGVAQHAVIHWED